MACGYKISCMVSTYKKKKTGSGQEVKCFTRITHGHMEMLEEKKKQLCFSGVLCVRNPTHPWNRENVSGSCWVIPS